MVLDVSAFQIPIWFVFTPPRRLELTASKRQLPQHPNRPLRIAETLRRAAEAYAANGAVAEPKTLAEAGFSQDDVKWLSGALAIHPTPKEIAWHESGHAVTAAAFGVEVVKVSIERQPVTRCAAIYSAYVEHLIMHAGPIAERLARGLVYRPFDDELRPWIAMGSNRWFGNHDYSKLFARSAIDYPTWNDATRLAHFRKYETLTIELLTRRPFKAALAATADALLGHGTISGEVVADIVSKFITEADIEGV